MEFELKNSDCSLKIEPLASMWPEAEYDYDRNMLNSRIIINAGKFNGDYNAVIATFDFKRLKEGFLKLYNNLGGTFNFEPIEGQLSIKIKVDGIGHFYCDCLATEDPGIDLSELRFNLTFDQTQINDFVEQLDSINKSFPIIGDF
jgi:hypothetical protein